MIVAEEVGSEMTWACLLTSSGHDPKGKVMEKTGCFRLNECLSVASLILHALGQYWAFSLFFGMQTFVSNDQIRPNRSQILCLDTE